LITQQTGLVYFDGSLMSRWIMAIMQPILNQFQIVAGATTIDPHPMNSLYQQSLQPVLFQRGAAEIEAPQSFLFADELSHRLPLLYIFEAKSPEEQAPVC
jgi:hypothetical protein